MLTQGGSRWKVVSHMLLSLASSCGKNPYVMSASCQPGNHIWSLEVGGGGMIQTETEKCKYIHFQLYIFIPGHH